MDHDRTTSAILSTLGSGKTIFPFNSATIQPIRVLETEIPYIAMQSIPYTILCVTLYCISCGDVYVDFFLDKQIYTTKIAKKNLPCIHQKMVNSYQWIVAGNIELDPFTKLPTWTPTRPMAPPEWLRLQP